MTNVAEDVFDATPPPAIERLARIEGQSNFLSLLAGIVAGPDTTEDMAALSFSRARGGLPEAIEAHIGQSDIFRLPLMSMTFDAICAELRPKPEELNWMRCATADGFLLFRSGQCKASALRAKRCKVQKSAYLAIRKLAYSVLMDFAARSEVAWLSARR